MKPEKCLQPYQPPYLVNHRADLWISDIILVLTAPIGGVAYIILVVRAAIEGSAYYFRFYPIADSRKILLQPDWLTNEIMVFNGLKL